MGSFVTLDLHSLIQLLETCHDCSTDNPSQVSTEESLSKRLGNDAARQFTFLCCGKIVNTQGAIFWHSDDITPDSILCGDSGQEDKTDSKHLEKDNEMSQFEDIIVKCEEDHCRVEEDSDDVIADKEVVEEDPLSLDKPVNRNTVHAKEMDLYDQSSEPFSSKNLRKNLLSILSYQDALGESELYEESGERGTRQNKYPESFACEFCGKVFVGKERAYQFYYHRNKEHTHEMLYRCDICMKEFWGDRELLAHMTGHRNPEEICHVCGKRFSDKRNLKKHLLVHLPSKEHICEFCNKKFKRKDHLQVHERIHTGVRPYQCKWCDSAYPQKRQLTLHLKNCPILKRQECKA